VSCPPTQAFERDNDRPYAEDNSPSHGNPRGLAFRTMECITGECIMGAIRGRLGRFPRIAPRTLPMAPAANLLAYSYRVRTPPRSCNKFRGPARVAPQGICGWYATLVEPGNDTRRQPRPMSPELATRRWTVRYPSFDRKPHPDGESVERDNSKQSRRRVRLRADGPE